MTGSGQAVAEETSIPLAVAVQLEAAARLGYGGRVLDPEFGYLFELEGRGHRRVLIGGRSALNDAIASRLSEDKHYTILRLERLGVRVPRTVRCLGPQWEAKEDYRDRIGIEPARDLARELGYPLVVKPNRLSHGRGVRRVDDRPAMEQAFEEAFAKDNIALAQEYVHGRDFRLDFLDGEYLIGYERVPIRVEGDGERSIGQLLRDMDERYSSQERMARLEGSLPFEREVRGRGRDLQSVLDPGEALELHDGILNLQGLATGRVLFEIPDAWTRHCLELGKALHLRHFGVDLRADSLDGDPARACVLELNASPLLLHLYRMGFREEVLEAQGRVLERTFDAIDEGTPALHTD